MRPESHYQAYILRVWQVERDQQPVVVASLEDSRTSQRKAFASLPALLEFLEMAAQPGKSEDESDPKASSEG
jgi:hypothetical protein